MTKLISIAISCAIVLFTGFAFGDQTQASPSKKDVLSWATARMVYWHPPGKSWYVGAKETPEEGLIRYESIVEDAMSVAFDPNEDPLFNGPHGRYKTLAILLAIADSESGFRKDVDLGKGPEARGDGGRSHCLTQIQLGVLVGGKTKTRLVLDGPTIRYSYDGTGLGGEDLTRDRKNCFRASLHIARLSFISCSSLPLEGRLSLYASGSCGKGMDASRMRVRKAIRWLAESAPPSTDMDLMVILGVNPKMIPVVQTREPLASVSREDLNI